MYIVSHCYQSKPWKIYMQYIAMQSKVNLQISSHSVPRAIMLLQESQGSTPSSEVTALEVDGHEDSSSPAGKDRDGPRVICPSWKGLDWLDIANLDELQGHDSMFKSFAKEHAGEWNHRKAKSWGGQSHRSGSDMDNVDTQPMDTQPMQKCPKGTEEGQQDEKDTHEFVSEDLQSGDEGKKNMEGEVVYFVASY